MLCSFDAICMNSVICLNQPGILLFVECQNRKKYRKAKQNESLSPLNICQNRKELTKKNYIF